MKGLAWKIALLTAVLAVGFLVILQAQRGMTQAMLAKSNEAQAPTPPSASPATAPTTENATASTSTAPGDPFGEAAPARDVSVVTPVESKKDDRISAPPVTGANVAAKDSARPPEKAPSDADSRVVVKETVANDPFADSGDDKHAGRAPEKKNPPTTATDVKQASASSEAKGLEAPNAAPAHAAPIPDGGPKLPDEIGPSLDDPKQDGPKSVDRKSGDSSEPPKQSEPPVDHKPADQKPSAGPQLPDAGPTLDLPPSGNSPPPPEPSSAKNSASLPHQEGGSTTPSTPPDPLDKPSAKSTASDPAGAPAPTSPKPFPDAGPKEAPVPAPPAPSADSSNSTPSGPPVLDLTPSNSPPSAAPSLPAPNAPSAVPPAKSVDASNASPAARSPGEPRPDAAVEFQGDGTVGDAAPLGPQRPQLNIEKIAPQNALIGQPLIYSILVKNVGQSAAREVVVEDRIPKGTKLSGTIPRAELTGKKLIWRLGTLGGGEQRKISIRVIPLEAGEIGSVATVNFVAEAAAETVVTAPRLEFKISAPSAARLGEQVPFRFEVRNLGTGEARGVVIRDLIPQGFSHSAGNDLEYEVGRLMPGKSKQLTLDLKADKVGTVVNRAVALAEGGLTAEAKAAVEISGSKVALTRNGPQRRYLGRQALFTNTLVNESSFPVDGVVLVESVPTGMEFAGATHGGQYNDGSRTIAWRLDQMAPGETRVVKSRLVARGLGNQTSTVRLTVPNGEPVEATSQTEVEGFAALGLDVSGVDGPVDQGEKITLHIDARNKGTVTVTNVVVTVELPENVEVVSARGPGKTHEERGRLKFGPIASLEGRTSAACEIVLAARKRGDSRVRVSVQADQIDKPLAREESILILSESSESAAPR